jgi:hypothetical protein
MEPTAPASDDGSELCAAIPFDRDPGRAGAQSTATTASLSAALPLLGAGPGLTLVFCAACVRFADRGGLFDGLPNLRRRDRRPSALHR